MKGAKFHCHQKSCSLEHEAHPPCSEIMGPRGRPLNGGDDVEKRSEWR